MSTTSDTPTPPKDYHIATEQERQCLPDGTKIWLVFDQEWGKSANIGRQADDGSLYACPDQPAPQPSPEPAQPWQPAVGDTVRLKSGGPVMVVKKIGEYVTCLFNTETGPHQCQAPTACLTPAQP